MARRYLTINVSEEQRQFTRLLDEWQIKVFTIDEIKHRIGRFANLNAILENLVDKQLLSRIEKGKYCNVNFRNEQIIGSFLVKEGAIAYQTALSSHGLCKRAPNIVFVQTPLLKRDKTVFGVRYNFIKVNRSKIDGVIRHADESGAYNVTDLEKTIVDCFDLPEYSNGYGNLIRAFHSAKLDNEKLIQYCERINNIALIKRLGCLAAMTKPTDLSMFVQFARTRVNKRYNLFDPMGNNSGDFVSEWRLRMNISRNEISEIVKRLPESNEPSDLKPDKK